VVAVASAKSQGEMLVGSRPTLLAYIRRRVDDLETAEEIVQEVSLRALAGTAPEDPQSFLLWSCGIARHVIFQEWRRRCRTRSEQPPGDFIVEGVRDPKPPTDRLLDARTALARAIGDDTESFSLLLRRYMDGESSKQLAKELGVTTAALRMRLSRSRASARAQSEHSDRIRYDFGPMTLRSDSRVRNVSIGMRQRIVQFTVDSRRSWAAKPSVG